MTLLKERVIDLENGGAMFTMKNSIIKMSSSYEKEDYTFPSAMTLRFQAVRSACQFQRKYWIGSLAALLLIIVGIVSTFIIVSKDSVTENSTTPEPEPAKNYSKKYSNCSVLFCSVFV